MQDGSCQPPSGSSRPPTSDQVRALFRERGLRWTRQRESLYNALAMSRSHPTAEELFEAVRVQAVRPQDDAGPDERLSLATVYNALDAFVESGLVDRLSGEVGGSARYDATTGWHAHLTTHGGEILDIPAELGHRLRDALDERFVHDLERRLGRPIGPLKVTLTEEDPGRGR